jgi:hypothetical protein
MKWSLALLPLGLGCSAMPSMRTEAGGEAPVVSVCPQPPQVGEGVVRSRPAQSPTLSPLTAQVVVVFLSAHPTKWQRVPGGAVWVHASDVPAESMPVHTFLSDAEGRATVTLMPGADVNVFGRPIGYQPLSHRFRARGGFADTLEFFVRTNWSVHCE